jgi:thiamine-phosphate pyrophosphorylase
MGSFEAASAQDADIAAPVTRAGAPAVERLLDANLDRAREGLRVLEDWARFALERSDLVARCKDLRQRLGLLHLDRYKLARHTAGDGAAGMGHPAQVTRREPGQVLAANAARVQEALRVLEEFGRGVDPELAAEAAVIRYAIYDLEVDLLRAGLDPLHGGPEHSSGRGQDLRRRLEACRLYLVSSPVPHLERVVGHALAAGVRLVQYRAKEGGGLDDRRRLEQAQRLRELCARHDALFLVNDRIDLALAVDADGVHLGQEDLPVAVARRLLGPERLIGRSTHAIEQLRRAVAEGCDYLGVGPVNATPTKPGREPVGLAYVAAAAAEAPIPFFAIGGIDATNLAVVLAAGARRVAVVRAITAAADPGAATAELLDLLKSGSVAA